MIKISEKKTGFPINNISSLKTLWNKTEQPRRVFKNQSQDVKLSGKFLYINPSLGLISTTAYIVFNMDQAYNKSFHDNLESIQYSASLAITIAIRGTSRGKLYQEFIISFANCGPSTRSTKINFHVVSTSC